MSKPARESKKCVVAERGKLRHPNACHKCGHNMGKSLVRWNKNGMIVRCGKCRKTHYLSLTLKR